MWSKIRGIFFQQYTLRLGYCLRVKVIMKETTLINNSFGQLDEWTKIQQNPPGCVGILIIIAPLYIGIPKKAPLAPLHPHHFHHGGNGDVSTLDWSEVPEGILHYEVPHVSTMETVVILLTMSWLKMMMEVGDKNGWYLFLDFGFKFGWSTWGVQFVFWNLSFFWGWWRT